MNDHKYVYLLSDATGTTVEKIAQAGMSQFGEKATIRLFGNVRTKSHVYNALDKATQERALVVYTIVNRELAHMVHDECEALGIMALDLITPLLLKLADYFGHSPRQIPGLLHDIDEEYFRRIEAIEFTVKNDDGKETRFLNQADIVLVGVSRTSKTPLSMYLAHRGWKVANIPLVQGIDIPEELLKMQKRHTVGLVINPERLMELRAARLKNLGQNPKLAYADYEQIEQELTEARRFFRRQGWPIVNVTGKAVEETANEVLTKLKLTA